MHWAPDGKWAACGKRVDQFDRPHYIINADCIVPVTCEQCEAKRAAV